MSLESGQQEQIGEGDLSTGRFEAHATPSNFLPAMRYDTPGIDIEHDDPADIEDKAKRNLIDETHGNNVDISGVSKYEQAIADSADAKQADMRTAYKTALDSGLQPDAAREKVIEDFRDDKRGKSKFDR